MILWLRHHPERPANRHIGLTKGGSRKIITYKFMKITLGQCFIAVMGVGVAWLMLVILFSLN